MTAIPEMIDPARYSSLGELLADALITFKSETALVEVDRKTEKSRYSYLDFKREAQKIIALFKAHSVGPDDRVAILMSNQSRWLIGAYAAFHCGAVVIPLDYKLSASEQKALVLHGKPKVLITEHGLLRRLDALPVELVLVSEPAPNATYANEAIDWDVVPASTETFPVTERTREDLACIVYSSGTGGRAKGCMLTHDAYLEQLATLMEVFPMHPGHRVFSILPTNHAIDFMTGFVGPFSCGAMVVHQRTLRPEFLQPTMQAYGITHMALVPALLTGFEQSIQSSLLEQPKWARRAVSVLSGLNEMLTADKPRASVSRRLLSPIHESFGGKLEVLFCGGAFVDRKRAEHFYRLGLPVVIGYGLTEVCTVATVNDLSPFRADSVGRAVRGVEIRIDGAGPDGVGEVWIRGRTRMKGYLDDPELTRRAITEDGWLKTGDLGWLDAAHHLHLVGRSKNMIVTAGGKNVYPEDVEGAFEDLPVEEIAIYASNYLWPKHGELADEQLVAVVRPRKGNGVVVPSDETVVAQLRSKNRALPDYKRLRGVLFWGEQFPRTASMKLKRDALAASLRGKAREDEVQSL